MFKFSVTVKLAKLPVDTSRKLKVPVDELMTEALTVDSWAMLAVKVLLTLRSRVIGLTKDGV